MTQSIASLRIDVDTSDVARAQASITNLGQAARTAGTGVQSMTTQQQASAALLTQWTAAMNAAAGATSSVDAAARNNSATQQSVAAALGATTQAVQVSNRAFTQFNDGLTATERAAAKASAEQLRLRQTQEALAAAARGAEAMQREFLQSLADMAKQVTLTRAELLRLQAAELGVADAAEEHIKEIEKATGAHHQFSLASSGTVRELGVMARELGNGNYGRFASSLSIVANNAGLTRAALAYMTVGLGLAAAAIAVAIRLYEQAAAEATKMNNAIAMTGNYAGTSAAQMNALAAGVAKTHLATLNESRELVVSLVQSGQIGRQVLADVAMLAVNYAKATGQEVDKLTPKLVQMFADPVKGAREFNDSTHALTVTQLEHIQTLENLGEHEKAQKALADDMTAAIPNQMKHLTMLGEVVKTLATAWQSVTHWAGLALHGMDPSEQAQSDLDYWKTYADDLKRIHGLSDNDPAVKAALDHVKVAEGLIARLKGEAQAQSDVTAANMANAASWELVRSKSQEYHLQQLQQQRQKAAAFRPDPQQKDETANDYQSRLDSQQAAKADALASIDREIANLRKSIQTDDLADAQHAAENRIKNTELAKKIELDAIAEGVKAAEAANKAMEMGDDELYENKRTAIDRTLIANLSAIKRERDAAASVPAYTHDDQLAKADKLADYDRKEVEARAQRNNQLADLDREREAQQKADARADDERVNAYLGALGKQVQAAEDANTQHETSRAFIEREAAARADLALTMTREFYAQQVMSDATPEQLAATEKTINLLEQQVALRTRLANAYQKSDDLKTDAANWAQLGRVGQQVAQTLAESFGHVGQAIGGMTASLLDYAKTQHDIAQQLKQTLADTPQGDTAARQKAIDEAMAKSTAAQIKNYGDMTGAAKGFFKEGSAGYKTLEAAEKGFRVVELAMAIANTVKKISLSEADVAAVVTGSAAKVASSTTEAGAVVVNETVKGQAMAVTAVANQAAGGDPYSAWPRMALMAAAMAALGFAVSGAHGGGPGPNDAASVQEHQGTGTVLGDAKAKSESITKALSDLADNSDLTLPLTAQMAASLKAIESGIGGIGNLAVRAGATDAGNMRLSGANLNLSGVGALAGAVGGGMFGSAMGSLMTLGTTGSMALTGIGAWAGPIGMAVGAIAGALLGKLMGGTDSSVTDAGLMIGGKVGGLEAGQGVDQYANVHTSSHGLTRLFSGGPKDSVQTQAAPLEIQNQFALVFKSLDGTLQAAAQALGQDADAVAAAIDNVTLASTKISLQGLSGQALTDAITNVLSGAMDQVAHAALPGLDAFQQIGEGYAETVVRVATGVEQAKVALDHFHVAAIGYDDIVNKQGDVGAELVRQSLLVVETQRGGLSGVGKIVQTLQGTVADIAGVYDELLKLRTLMNDVKMNGFDLGQDMLSGAGGAKALGTGLTDYRDKYFTDAEKNAAALADLKQQFDALGVAMPGTKAGFRALIEATGTATPAAAQLTGGLLTLAGAFADAMDGADALTGKADLMTKAQNDLQAAYNKAAGDLKNTIANLANFGKQLQQFDNSLATGSNSPLTPEQQYAAAKQQYDATASKAKAGDADAQAQFTQVAQTFLNASRTVNASDQQYQADYAAVIRMTSDLQGAAVTQTSLAQQQLDALNQSVQGILSVNDAVLSMADAINNLALAIGQTGGMSQGTAASNATALTGLYQNLLGRAPDASGLAYWMHALLSGATLDQIAQEFKDSPEYQGLHGSHAGGLERVPFNGYRAELHAGETVVDAQATAALRRYFGAGGQSAGDPTALVNEIRALRTEVAKLREDNERQAGQLAQATKGSGEQVAGAVERGVKNTVWMNQQARRKELA